MNLPEIFGYIAAGLVLATFSMRTMLHLRVVAITSNVAFIIYGFLAGLLPVFILHLILLPLNVYRFFEMRRLVREIQDAADSGHGLSALLPYMKPITVPGGTRLFEKGDGADAMYIISSGHVRIPEFDIEIGPGEMVGEIGMFSPGAQRLTSAVCAEDCRLQRITRDRVRELVYQNPRIGFHLIGVITGRLLEDVGLLQQRLAEATGVAH